MTFFKICNVKTCFLAVCVTKGLRDIHLTMSIAGNASKLPRIRFQYIQIFPRSRKSLSAAANVGFPSEKIMGGRKSPFESSPDRDLPESVQVVSKHLQKQAAKETGFFRRA